MKKFVLVVASILAAIQSIANRSVEGSDSIPLILSPSDGIYNHGSHASHASHASHFSMIVKVAKDSVRNVSLDDRKSIIHSLALMHSCAEKEISIMSLYISQNNGIITLDLCPENHQYYRTTNRYTPASNEKCLYIRFSYFHIEEEYIIPLSNAVSNYFRIESHRYYNVGEKKEWMVDFANKNK